MKRRLKQFACLMLTAHSDSRRIQAWFPTIFECNRCGARVAFN